MQQIDDITTRYSLGRLLGKGAFGSVYKCTNRLTKEVCAMKIMKKTFFKGEEALVELIQNELEVLESIDHPHIVQVIEMFEDSVNLYIVSELMKGGELYEFMVKIAASVRGKRRKSSSKH